MAPSPGSKHLEVSGAFNQMSERSQSIDLLSQPPEKTSRASDSVYHVHFVVLGRTSRLGVVVESPDLVINKPIFKYGARREHGPHSSGRRSEGPIDISQDVRPC